MNYNNLLRSPAKRIWKRIGTKRRSGVVIPLFSIYSKNSIGIGEIPDLKLVVDWCVQTGMSIVQLLPMNELGYDASPYNSISTFALEPVYLRLQELRGIDLQPFDKNFRELRFKFKNRKSRVDYRIRSAKYELLKRIYENANLEQNREFNSFVLNNKYWLIDYAVYKVLKEKNNFKSWEEWKTNHRQYNRKTAAGIIKNYKKKIYFHYWIQWQLYEQMKEVKSYASVKGVLIMGDLPFLVSSDSADIWSHQEYFNLHLSAGAPPDMYFAFGQKWGMPTYNWKVISRDKFTYIRERIKYAANFYDMYRIDHFVGLFRIWTTLNNPEDKTDNDKDVPISKFDPAKRSEWEQHGKKIINQMLKSSDMLPCAEDLGTVPACSYKTLKEYGIPGIDFQRFNKKPGKNFEFVPFESYRKNSAAVISTHDTSFFPAWWHNEAGTIDKALFEFICRSNNINGKALKGIKDKLFDENYSRKGRLFWRQNIRSIRPLLKFLKFKKRDEKKLTHMYKETYGEKEKFIDYLGLKNKQILNPSPAFQFKCIERAGSSASVFSIQMIHEYLFLNRNLFSNVNKSDYRINMPGVVSENNWSLRIPLSLESILHSPKGKDVTEKIRRINKKTQRV